MKLASAGWQDGYHYVFVMSDNGNEINCTIKPPTGSLVNKQVTTFECATKMLDKYIKDLRKRTNYETY